MPLFNESVTRYLYRGLDASSLRQRVIAHNLANFNTPRYSRSYVSFEEELQKSRDRETSGELRRTHSRHISLSPGDMEPQVHKDRSTARRLDGNNVDLEKEMLELVNNQLRFSTMSQQVKERFDTWRYLLNEGGL